MCWRLSPSTQIQFWNCKMGTFDQMISKKHLHRLKVITVIAFYSKTTHDGLGNSKARNVESPIPEVIHKTLAIVIDFIIDN